MIEAYQEQYKESVLEIFDRNSPRYFHSDERKDFVHYLDSETEDYFILKDHGKIVGCGGINYFPEAHKARISWDLFLPEYQGRGLGRLLLQHRIDTIKKKKHFKLIEVRTSQLAFGFYKKNGFKIDMIQANFWADGLDLYLMKMDI